MLQLRKGIRMAKYRRRLSLSGKITKNLKAKVWHQTNRFGRFKKEICRHKIKRSKVVRSRTQLFRLIRCSRNLEKAKKALVKVILRLNKLVDRPVPIKSNKKQIYSMQIRLDPWESRIYTPLKGRRNRKGKWCSKIWMSRLIIIILQQTTKTQILTTDTTDLKRRWKAYLTKTWSNSKMPMAAWEAVTSKTWWQCNGIVRHNPQEIFRLIWFSNCSSRRIRRWVHRFSNCCSRGWSNSKPQHLVAPSRDPKAKQCYSNLCKKSRINRLTAARKDLLMFRLIKCLIRGSPAKSPRWPLALIVRLVQD